MCVAKLIQKYAYNHVVQTLFSIALRHHFENNYCHIIPAGFYGPELRPGTDCSGLLCPYFGVCTALREQEKAPDALPWQMPDDEKNGTTGKR